MRTIRVILLLLGTLALAVDAGAQAPKRTTPKQAAPKQTTKANPAPSQGKKSAGKRPRTGSAAAAYAALSEAERIALQTELAWAGTYNGMADGNFNEGSIAAVKDYQKQSGARDTGILNADERARLARFAKARQEQVGWRVLDDRVTGARLGLPAKLVPQSTPAGSGARWQSAHGEVQVETFRVLPPVTLSQVFEQQKKEPAQRKPDYSVLRPDFFVISGLQGLKKFYVRAHIKDDEVRGVTILYDQATEGIMDPVAVAMSSAFAPFPTGPIPGSAARQRVEYGSGIVVSPAGYILTDRQLVDGCDVILAAGSNAEKLAEDSDLALLRLYGARDLMPVPLAGAAARAGEVSLFGIADPQAQGGGGAVTSQRARILPASPATEAARMIEPAPLPGFSGAAAFDGDARLIGMVEWRPQAVAGLGQSRAGASAFLVPAATIANFLAAQNVPTPTGTGSNLESAKRSVVRVICVRK